MTREEAINEIRSWDFFTGNEIEVIQALVPELCESEDEKAKKIIASVFSEAGNRYIQKSERNVVLAYLEKQKEQKPAMWSDKDERMLTNIIERGRSQVPPYDKALREDQIEWLTDRFKFLNPQPMQEWNEEDERMVRFYKNDYDNNLGDMPMCDVIENRVKFKDWLINRLRSIRPKHSWKPNEE